MRIELFSWGAAEEVTGSKHFLRLKDRLLMVDCGAFQGHRDEAEGKNRNWPFNAAEVSAVILTHAHYDHCGLLPLLPRKGFPRSIYSTPATRDLANLIMMDSAHIQAKDLEFLYRRAQKKKEHFDRKPLYTEQDVVRSLAQFVTVSYHRPTDIMDGVNFTFFDAGHILGSALAVFDIDHNGQQIKVAFSGDLGRKNLPIIRDPEMIPPVDYLIMESTYGDRLHEPVERAMVELELVINRTVERGGTIIIPSFAMERTQELVYFIHLLHDAKRIPKLPTFVDSPMATNATSIFQIHQECYDEEIRDAFLVHHKNPFGFYDLRYIVSEEESKQLNDLAEPAIIISSSGMCEYGRILHHLARTIEDPRHTILIVGYMAKHTLGRKIQEKQPEVKIFGDLYKLRAEVVSMGTLSAHADYNDILEYISKLDFHRLKQIFLVHGEPESQTHLKDLLKEKGFKTSIVKYGQRYDLFSG